MRLFSFRDPTGQGTSYLFGTEVAGWSLADGVRPGRLLDDGRVEVDPRRSAVRRGELTPAPAVPRPGKIVCVGLNYRSHIEEQGVEPPTRPLLFAKFANAIVADGEPIVRPPGTHALDLEAELGVVMSRPSHRVPARSALRHIAGYVVVNDVTARDWQGNRAALRLGEHGDGQWLRAKGSDTFLPMGPDLVTADEFDGPPDLVIRSWRTPATGPDAGRPILMQEGRTGDLIFGIPELIEFITSVITLDPGDVIATGTPSGVGVFREPPVFLEPGDRVRVEIEGIGSVENPVVDGSVDPAIEEQEAAMTADDHDAG